MAQNEREKAVPRNPGGSGQSGRAPEGGARRGETPTPHEGARRGETAATPSNPDAGGATPRTEARSTEGDATQSANRGDQSASSDSRARQGRPATGQAVARRADTGDGHRVIVVPPYYGGYYPYYGGYYPWGYGGIGLGAYYGGFYDPWWDGGYPADAYASGYDGALRLKVKPRDADVYVDGYFAGRVDDYDGIFQRLRVDPGPHRIEIRQEGYEPLLFEVRIQPDKTLTYTGELEKTP